MVIRRWIVVPVLAAALSIGSAAAEQRWLHVHVDGGGGDDRVNVNVPLDLVETILPLIQVDEMRGGRFLVTDDDFDGIDLREIVSALRDTADTTFVTARSDDATVRVAKEGGFLIVHVDEGRRRSKDNVRIRVPLVVFDALVGSDPHELDLLAALRALREFDGEDLVRIESDDETVRIWIDANANGS